jgi:hypothetical protein
MIGIAFLVGIVLWVTVAVMVSKRIPRWIGMTKHTTVVSLLVFPLVLAAPIADDLIGRWQFYRLCDREAVVTLSPDWEKVKRAKYESTSQKSLDGYFIPINSGGGKYIDLETGKVFMTFQMFFARGGFLTRPLNLSSQDTTCYPRDIVAINKQINTSELLKQGEMK